MARQFDDIFVSLALPFEGNEIRILNQAGRDMPYVTGRTVMNRLDDVIGPTNWWDEYVPMEKCVICRLTIRLADGTTITKSDAGGYADMKDEGDGEKAGFSDAFKRAAVKFGIGRHLYSDGVPEFVRTLLGREDDPELMAKPKGPTGGGYGGGNRGGYQPPAPARGRDEVNRQFTSNGSSPRPAPAQSGGGNGDCPRDGKGLFMWAKDQEKAGQHDMLKQVNQIIEEKFGRMRTVDLSPDQTAQVWDELSDVIPF